MKKLCVMVFVAVFGISVAAAQDLKARVTVFGAGSFLSGERVFMTDDDDDVFRTKYDNGGKFGVRFTADLTDRWAADGSYSFGRNNLRVTEIDQPNTIHIFQTNLHQFAANGSYFFRSSEEALRPFLTAGLSLTRVGPTKEAQAMAAQNLFDEPARISATTQPGVNFGGGLENKVNDWLGVRVDVRDHIMRIPRLGLPVIPLNPGGAFYPVTGSVHNVEASAGAVFYLR